MATFTIPFVPAMLEFPVSRGHAFLASDAVRSRPVCGRMHLAALFGRLTPQRETGSWARKARAGTFLER